MHEVQSELQGAPYGAKMDESRINTKIIERPSIFDCLPTMDSLNTMDPPEEEHTPEARELIDGSARNLCRRDYHADVGTTPTNPILRALLLKPDGLSFSANIADPDDSKTDGNYVSDYKSDSILTQWNSSKTVPRTRTQKLEPSAKNSMGDPDGIDALNHSHNNSRRHEVTQSILTNNASVQAHGTRKVLLKANLMDRRRSRKVVSVLVC